MSQADTVYQVRRNDTLTGIARAHGVSIKELASHNQIPADTKVIIGQRLKIPSTADSSSSRLYTVKPNDTLSGLARRYGMTLTRLARYNGLRTDAWLRIGQKIRVPNTGSSSPSSLSTLPVAVRTAIGKASVTRGRWKYIVLHHSATSRGSAKGMDRYHREERHMENGLAYHFVIGNGRDMRDGEIAVGNRWTRQLHGGHLASESLNGKALGICLVGNFDKTMPTARQLKSLEALVDALRSRCNLPQSAIRTHQQINPVHTRCPGKRFAASSALRSLQGK